MPTCSAAFEKGISSLSMAVDNHRITSQAGDKDAPALRLKDDLSKLILDPHTTYLLGFSVSTYQNKTDPSFAKASNWGELEERLFSAEQGNIHLSSGGGVDILTPSGRNLICSAVRLAHGNALRFSIEWADIQPTKDYFNPHAIEKYVEALKEIRKQGIVPLVTLHHFVEPLWFSQLGGFKRQSNIRYFVEYAVNVYRHLAPYIDHVVTFNEASVYAAMGYVIGDFPPNQILRLASHKKVLRNIFSAHRQVYEELHLLASKEGRPLEVGLSHQALQFIPTSSWNPLAVGICYLMNNVFHNYFMDLIEKNPAYFDFLGIQYYSRPLIGGLWPTSLCNPEEKMVESMNFRFDPGGIGEVLKDVSARFPNIPIYITETGTAYDGDLAEADGRRAEYYLESFKAVAKAQKEGVNVKAYLAWTLFGNFEWAHGYSAAHDFGVIHRKKSSNSFRVTKGFQVIQQVFYQTLLAKNNLFE